MEKLNHSKLNFNCGAINANVNLYTGQVNLKCPGLNIGANSFNIESCLIYKPDIGGFIYEANGHAVQIGSEGGWILNLQQYAFLYNKEYGFDGFDND